MTPQAREQIRRWFEHFAEVDRLQGVLDRALALLSMIYRDHRTEDSSDSDWADGVDVPCEFCRSIEALRASLPAAEERPAEESRL